MGPSPYVEARAEVQGGNKMSQVEPNIQAKPSAKRIVSIEDERVADANCYALVAERSTEALTDEAVLTAHLWICAPDRLMEGFELEKGSCKLYQALKPKNTIQRMMATLLVNVFNTSSSCLADGTMRSCPPHIRDINIKHGLKAGALAADLLMKFNEMQSGDQ